MLINYRGNKTDVENLAVAKQSGGKYFVKYSKYGNFYNENNLWHAQALKFTDTHPYLWVKVPELSYNWYVKFLQTKNEFYLRKAERLYNENQAN